MSASAAPLATSVQGCIDAGHIPDRGEPLALLALAYARQIDRAIELGAEDQADPVKVLADLGPKLQAALVSLGLAVVLPAAGRPDAGKPGAASTPPSDGAPEPGDMLAALRAERDRRTG